MSCCFTLNKSSAHTGLTIFTQDALVVLMGLHSGSGVRFGATRFKGQLEVRSLFRGYVHLVGTNQLSDANVLISIHLDVLAGTN